MYSDFVFLDRFLFELSCKNTHTHTHTHTNTDAHTHTHTHTHRDSNEYPIVAFSKNATIKIAGDLNQDLPVTTTIFSRLNDTSTLYRGGSFKTTGSFWCLFKTSNSQTTLCALSRPCWHSFH